MLLPCTLHVAQYNMEIVCLAIHRKLAHQEICYMGGPLLPIIVYLKYQMSQGENVSQKAPASNQMQILLRYFDRQQHWQLYYKSLSVRFVHQHCLAQTERNVRFCFHPANWTKNNVCIKLKMILYYRNAVCLLLFANSSFFYHLYSGLASSVGSFSYKVISNYKYLGNHCQLYSYIKKQQCHDLISDSNSKKKELGN